MNNFPCKDKKNHVCFVESPLKSLDFLYDNGCQEAVLPSKATEKDHLVPIGPECAKKHKVLKSFVITIAGRAGGSSLTKPRRQGIKA